MQQRVWYRNDSVGSNNLRGVFILDKCYPHNDETRRGGGAA